MTFIEKLTAAQVAAKSWLCLGLDPDINRLPPAVRNEPDAVAAFNTSIIQATHDLVCAYKPNLAFYLAQGVSGLQALEKTLRAIPDNIPVVLDAKFGDIDSSARGYAHFAFAHLGVDAVTVNPYLGADALAPFLEDEEHAIFVLAHTSNPGAGKFQDALHDNKPLYVQVAEWAGGLKGQVGLVVGATFPDQLQQVRRANPSAILLIPGVGTQGGRLDATVHYGENDRGVGPLINASRSILYASSGEDFAHAAKRAAQTMRDQINSMRLQQRTMNDRPL